MGKGNLKYHQFLLLLFIEKFPQRLSEQIIDLPITKEEVVSSQQTILILSLLVILFDLLVPDDLLHHWHSQISDLISELLFGIRHDDGVARV